MAADTCKDKGMRYPCDVFSHLVRCQVLCGTDGDREAGRDLLGVRSADWSVSSLRKGCRCAYYRQLGWSTWCSCQYSAQPYTSGLHGTPNVDSYWVGPAWPGPSYIAAGGDRHLYTIRTVRYMVYNLTYFAQLLRSNPISTNLKELYVEVVKESDP